MPCNSDGDVPRNCTKSQAAPHMQRLLRNAWLGIGSVDCNPFAGTPATSCCRIFCCSAQKVKRVCSAVILQPAPLALIIFACEKSKWQMNSVERILCVRIGRMLTGCRHLGGVLETQHNLIPHGYRSGCVAATISTRPVGSADGCWFDSWHDWRSPKAPLCAGRVATRPWQESCSEGSRNC
jgi:hypothetical protein